MAKILFLFVIIAASVANGEQCTDQNVQFSRLEYVFKKISTVYLKIGTVTKQIPVMISEGGKIYLIFQRRLNGTVDFYKKWDDYVKGFGNPEGEYWIGLNALNALTSTGKCDMTVFLEAFDGTKVFARYGIFQVGDAASKYKLRVGEYSGTAGDAMLVHDGKLFSTYDQDNDGRGDENCASHYHGAWWYQLCHEANLNGKYFPSPGKHSSYADGVNWKQFRDFFESMKTAVMALSLK